MSMDLWYDLAARELPDSDEEMMIEKLHSKEGVEPPHEPQPVVVDRPAVEFF